MSHIKRTARLLPDVDLSVPPPFAADMFYDTRDKLIIIDVWTLSSDDTTVIYARDARPASIAAEPNAQELINSIFTRLVNRLQENVKCAVN